MRRPSDCPAVFAQPRPLAPACMQVLLFARLSQVLALALVVQYRSADCAWFSVCTIACPAKGAILLQGKLAACSCFTVMSAFF